MGELEDAKAELVSLREAMANAKADADARVDALKKQQVEAKAKAKAVILRQKADANQKVQALQNEKDRQAEELGMVKEMLREEVEAKKRIQGRVEELEITAETGKKDLERIVAEKAVVEERVLEMDEQVKRAIEKGMAQRETLELRIGELEKEVNSEREKNSAAVEDENERMNGQVAAPEVSAEVEAELDDAKAKIEQLEAKCRELQRENEAMMNRASTDGGEAAAVDVDVKQAEDDASEDQERPEEEGEFIRLTTQEFEEQKSEISRLQTVIATSESDLQSANAATSATDEMNDLSEQLDDAQKKLLSATKEHGKALNELQKHNNDLEAKVASAEESATKLRSDLEKSELALQQEREKVLLERQKASETGAVSDDSKKVLEAKVAELERVIASKQADIVKVRDKARTYLKDINAEKREMEDRLKKEMETLRTELAQEQQKVREEEQRAESVSSELDNCLALIREKQKSIQVLKMTITSEKRAVDEARRETDALRTEFAGYKERARVALQEKESPAGLSETEIDKATTSLRTEVVRMKKENAALRKQIANMKQSDTDMKDLLERAQKAEAAVDLLRKGTAGVSTVDYRQVDQLEEKIASLQEDLTASRARAEDAEARQETSLMRLEAAERALRGAEVRAEEAERLSKRTIDELKKQVQSLESSLERAENSSAAAQRTAAAAAKALAFTSTQEEENNKLSPKRMVDVSPRRRDSISDDISSYSSAAVLNGGRASLAAALEGHEDSLRLGGPSDVFPRVNAAEARELDLESRDKQIAVLTAQVAELGALLDDAQQETNLKSEQTALLKAEVKNLDAKLAAAEKLQNGAPFSYLRTIVVRYLETEDPTLLPVVANILSFTKEEETRIKARKGSTTAASNLSANSQKSGYFSLPFLGSR